jgi:pimeloyl-ACP methyl ester carboxylesterase
VRALRWLFGLVLLTAIGVPLLAVASAYLSLDREMHHTRATAALPRVVPTSPDGLVRIPARGFEYRARVANLTGEGSPLILLHGFPETSGMWEPLIDAAAAAGYRVVAFDQRGYSPGARPDQLEAYALPELHADVLAIADAAGFERFHLAGHDWGSVVGWSVAGSEPDRVLSWTSLSIPHGGAITAARESDEPPGYIRVLRTRGLAETLMSAFGMRLLWEMYAEMPPALAEEYVGMLREPGALTAVIRWYRALPFEQQGSEALSAPKIEPPVLYIWGNRDMPVFVGPRVQAEHAGFMAGPFESIELDAGHWLMQEQTEAVVEATLAHLERFDGVPASPTREDAGDVE